MKIIGLMVTWNNLEFFKCSIKQALAFCDEVILVEGCHSMKYPERSDDGTVEFIRTLKADPKLRIMDFFRNGIYDGTQRIIRQRYPRQSSYYKPGNWVFQWDDDVLFFDKDLPRIKHIMENSKEDALNFNSRFFIYNFRFNCIRYSEIYCYRIIDDMKFRILMTPAYANHQKYSVKNIDDITLFHYGCVKKPERQRARWVMSVEKGAKVSIPRFDKWMGVSWKQDEDIFENETIIKDLTAGDVVNVYEGEHPEVLANHPWRHIDDVRKIS